MKWDIKGGSITSPNLDMSDMEPVELQHFGGGGDTAWMEVRHEYRHQAVCEM